MPRIHLHDQPTYSRAHLPPTQSHGQLCLPGSCTAKPVHTCPARTYAARAPAQMHSTRPVHMCPAHLLCTCHARTCETSAPTLLKHLLTPTNVPAVPAHDPVTSLALPCMHICSLNPFSCASPPLLFSTVHSFWNLLGTCCLPHCLSPSVLGACDTRGQRSGMDPVLELPKGGHVQSPESSGPAQGRPEG